MGHTSTVWQTSQAVPFQPAQQWPHVGSYLGARHRTRASAGASDQRSPGARPTGRAGVTGFADLRPFNVSRDFIGQAYHMTSGEAHYNDSINVNTVAAEGGSVVEFTSISLIGGALGDAGQNYKNIAMLAKATFGDDVVLTHLDGSCPAPAKER